MALLKRMAEQTPLYWPLRDWRLRYQQNRMLDQWILGGRVGATPHAVKQLIIKRYAAKFHLGVFVETGTCLGDMVSAMRRQFDQIYSIELSDDLYRRAHRRFQKDSHISLMHGDSGELLKQVVKQLDRPALFWLDSHYSGGATARGMIESPVLEELICILEAYYHNHIILIDDASLFGTHSEYPSLEQLTECCVRSGFSPDIKIENDIIHIIPTDRSRDTVY